MEHMRPLSRSEGTEHTAPSCDSSRWRRDCEERRSRPQDMHGHAQRGLAATGNTQHAARKVLNKAHNTQHAAQMHGRSQRRSTATPQRPHDSPHLHECADRTDLRQLHQSKPTLGEQADDQRGTLRDGLAVRCTQLCELGKHCMRLAQPAGDTEPRGYPCVRAPRCVCLCVRRARSCVRECLCVALGSVCYRARVVTPLCCLALGQPFAGDLCL